MPKYMVRFDLPTGTSFTAMVDGRTKISEHFTLGELANTKGINTQPQFVINEKVMKFVQCIEDLRKYCGVKFKCNSCYRQPAYNKSVGGSSNSLHLDGLAFDLGLTGYTDTQRAHVRDKWKGLTAAAGMIGGINYYTHGFHLSFDESKFGAKSFVFRDYRGKSGDW